MSLTHIVKQLPDKISTSLKFLKAQEDKPEVQKDLVAVQMIMQIYETAFEQYTKELEPEFRNNPENDDLTDEEYEAAWTKAVEGARKSFYKKASLFLHNDKLGSLKDDLEAVGLDIGTPFRILKKHYGEDILRDMANNPTDALQKWSVNLSSILSYFWDADDRYPQPLKAFAKIANWTVNLVLILGVFASLIPLGITYLFVALASAIERGFLNLFTDGQYQQQVDGYQKDPVLLAAATQQYISLLRSTYRSALEQMAKDNKPGGIPLADWDQYTDEQVRQFHMVQLATQYYQKWGVPAQEDDLNEQIDNTIKSLNAVEGFTHFKFAAIALFKAFTAPFPGGFFGNTLSLIGRALVLCSAPVFLAAAAIVETARYATALAFLGLVLGAAGIKTLTTLVTNAPIFIYDGLAFVGKTLSSCCNTPEETKRHEHFDLKACNQGPETLLLLGGPSQSSSSSKSEHHKHYASPLLSPSPKFTHQDDPEFGSSDSCCI